MSTVIGGTKGTNHCSKFYKCRGSWAIGHGPLAIGHWPCCSLAHSPTAPLVVCHWDLIFPYTSINIWTYPFYDWPWAIGHWPLAIWPLALWPHWPHQRPHWWCVIPQRPLFVAWAIGRGPLAIAQWPWAHGPGQTRFGPLACLTGAASQNHVAIRWPWARFGQFFYFFWQSIMVLDCYC